jgi:hypothetical protein
MKRIILFFMLMITVSLCGYGQQTSETLLIEAEHFTDDGGCMGEVVGMAASLCKKHSTTPRGVYQVHPTELKSLMVKGVTPSPKSERAKEQSLYDIPTDLTVPAVVHEKPQAGKRVRVTTPNWEKTNVYHTLYLPPDWTEQSRLPVIVEYAGNKYSNGQDVSDGTVDGCVLGYGLTAGKNAIWICLPFVREELGTLQNCETWWGSIEKTKQYCIETVEDVCRRFGGDSQRVILAGFSRGSLACFYIGLHDDKIARLWAGFFCHCHFDGVYEKWSYADADRVSALTRLKRLGTRPVWFSQEKENFDAAKHYLESTGLTKHFTIEPFPYPNHTAAWILRDLPIREKARSWLKLAFANDLCWQNGTLYFENNVIGKLSGEMTGGISVVSETLIPPHSHSGQLRKRFLRK